MTKLEECLFCGEQVTGDGVPISTLEGLRTNHRECALREVLGGIGHQIAHEYWCTQMHDPDAGLTRHQSALLVAFMYRMMGDELITRSSAFAPADAEVSAEGYSRASSDDEWGAAPLRWQEPSQAQLRPERPGPQQEPC